jgi:RAP domain
MTNTFLALSKRQGHHHVGLRMSRRSTSTPTSSSFSVAVSLRKRRNDTSFFSTWPFENVAAAAVARSRHHRGRNHYRLSSSCTASAPVEEESKRGGGGGGVTWLSSSALGSLRRAPFPFHFFQPIVDEIIFNAAAARYHHPHHDHHHHGRCYLRLTSSYPRRTLSQRRRRLPRHSPYLYTTASEIGWFASCCSFRDTTTAASGRRSFASNSKSNDCNTTGTRVETNERGAKAAKRRPPQKRRQQQQLQQRNELGVVSVSDILDDYMQNQKRLQVYQVAATWNHLAKAVQISRNMRTAADRQRSFWMDHKASLQALVDQTIRSANQFNGRSTATVMHSLVKILHLTNSKNLGEFHSLWNALLTTTTRHIKSGTFDAHSLSNLVWAYAKVVDGIKVDAQLLNAMAHQAELCVENFAPQGLSNVAWGFATLNHEAPSLFEAIARAAPVRINDFKPQELSNTAWSFATLKHEAPLLFDAIAAAAPVCIKDFNPQALANTAWSFATLKHEAPLLFDAIAAVALVRINDFNPQNLANTVWAFATLKNEAPLLFDASAQAAPVRINNFNPQSLANTAWAFATLNHEAPLLFDAIARAAPVRINDFNLQDLANTAWSFATLKHEAPLLFDAIAAAAPVCIKDFNPQALANTAWSFATLKHKAPSLFDAIARAAQMRILNFNPQDLANTAWSFATLKHEAPLLFDAIATAAPVRINGFKPQNLSNTSWAFATMNHDAPLLFEAIARAAPVRINDFNPQSLSNMAWAFATMNNEAPSLFDAIAAAAPVCIKDFNPQALANTAWAFAVFSIEPDLFIPAESQFAQKLQSMDPSSFNVEALSQLHQFQLWCQEQTGATCSWFPDELSRLCRQSFFFADVAPSRLQNDVVATLRDLQDVSSVEVEVSTPSGYRLDAAIVYQGVRIGVEVDGPSHFVGRSQSPNGSTILKRRQVPALESLKLVNIPYWEWNGIDKGSSHEKKEKKTQYLRTLLDEAILVRSSDDDARSAHENTDSTANTNVKSKWVLWW